MYSEWLVYRHVCDGSGGRGSCCMKVANMIVRLTAYRAINATTSIPGGAPITIEVCWRFICS